VNILWTRKDNIVKYTAFCGERDGDCLAYLKRFTTYISWLNIVYKLQSVEGSGSPILYIYIGRAVAEGWKWPRFVGRWPSFDVTIHIAVWSKSSAVFALMHAGRWLMTWKIGEDVRISLWSCATILSENLGLQLGSAKFIPRYLAVEQTENQQNICTATPPPPPPQQAEADKNLMKLTVTSDEMWVCMMSKWSSNHYNGNKNHPKDWKSLLFSLTV
jgi:hypothetical protein